MNMDAIRTFFVVSLKKDVESHKDLEHIAVRIYFNTKFNRVLDCYIQYVKCAFD